jgi:hypothetical protein
MPPRVAAVHGSNREGLAAVVQVALEGLVRREVASNTSLLPPSPCRKTATGSTWLACSGSGTARDQCVVAAGRKRELKALSGSTPWKGAIWGGRRMATLRTGGSAGWHAVVVGPGTGGGGPCRLTSRPQSGRQRFLPAAACVAVGRTAGPFPDLRPRDRRVSGPAGKPVNWTADGLTRRPRATQVARGTSGLHRAGWWVTPTRGNPQASATENRPPASRRFESGTKQVRVKRWCKRPPASRVTGKAR